MRLSIRWRITIWITLGLSIVIACFAALIYGFLHHALYVQTDLLLQTALGQLRGDPRLKTAIAERVNYWVEEYKDHQNLLCVVYRSDGTIFDQSKELSELSIPTLPATSQDRIGYDEWIPNIGHKRVLAERLRIGGQEYLVLLLAPLELVDYELNRMMNAFLVAGPISLLLSAGMAYTLARWVLSPVDRIRKATDAITIDRLERRVAVINPHDELGRLTQTINAMIARLENSFSEIRRFTADASHELRTPLTVLRTEVEVALGKSLTLTDHQQLLGNILEELVRMSRLTDQLLTLSRRDAGVEQFVPTPIRLQTLVAGVVDAMRPLAEAKGIELCLFLDSQVVVGGDEGRLRQVLINLLDNALKYTPQCGTVSVRVTEQDASGIVTLEDTGIGIPPEHLPHVFNRFYRADKARTRSEGGTGLGLSIALSIVKAHGGTIQIDSSIGQGTTFTVLLPRLADVLAGKGAKASKL